MGVPKTVRAGLDVAALYMRSRRYSRLQRYRGSPSPHSASDAGASGAGRVWCQSGETLECQVPMRMQS